MFKIQRQASVQEIKLIDSAEIQTSQDITEPSKKKHKDYLIASREHQGSNQPGKGNATAAVSRQLEATSFNNTSNDGAIGIQGTSSSYSISTGYNIKDSDLSAEAPNTIGSSNFKPERTRVQTNESASSTTTSSTTS